MIEKNVRREIFHLMERLWLWPITQTDATTKMSKEVWNLLKALERQTTKKSLVYALKTALGGVTKPPIGRPDILVLNPVGRGLVIEVKVFDKPRDGRWAAASFDTKHITPEQRNWMRMWTADSGWGYLGLGTVHGLPNREDKPRMLWLIPWDAYLKAEKLVRSCDTSTIPLTKVKGMRVALRESELWAMELFKPYAMVWDDGRWHMPMIHPLATFAEEKAGPTYVGSLFPELVNTKQYTAERDLKQWRKEWSENK